MKLITSKRVTPASCRKIERVRFGLLEHRDQHAAAVDFLAARRLRVQRRALQRALDAERVARRDVPPPRQSLDFARRGSAASLLAQRVEIGAAVLQDVAGGDVMQHRVEQMLEADVLVTAVGGLGHRQLQRDLQVRG